MLVYEGGKGKKNTKNKKTEKKKTKKKKKKGRFSKKTRGRQGFLVVGFRPGSPQERQKNKAGHPRRVGRRRTRGAGDPEVLITWIVFNAGAGDYLVGIVRPALGYLAKRPGPAKSFRDTKKNSPFCASPKKKCFPSSPGPAEKGPF